MSVQEIEGVILVEGKRGYRMGVKVRVFREAFRRSFMDVHEIFMEALEERRAVRAPLLDVHENLLPLHEPFLGVLENLEDVQEKWTFDSSPAPRRPRDFPRHP